jgi:peptidoglycan/LPS O-acetylase OafA/YrhL
MPVYVLTVVAALTFIDENADLGVVDWVQTLLMLDTFTHPTFPAGLTHMWSLAVEVTFYLVLPLLMLAGTGRRRTLRPWRIVLLLLAMCSTTIWWHLDGAARAGSPGAPLEWLPAYLTWFAVGIGLALVHFLHEEATRTGATSGRLVSAVVSVGRQPGSCWAVVIGLLLVSATPVAGPSMLAAPTPAESLTKNLLYAGIGALLVTSGVFATSDGRYVRLFGHVRLRRLGWISYSIFCLHLPLLHFVMWATGWPLFQGRGLQIWVLTLTLSLAAAEVTYRLVERPALRLKALRVGTRHETDDNAAARDTSTR